MDPEACLQRAQTALNDSDLDEAREALGDYWRWRGVGGFMPENGDARAAVLECDLQERGLHQKEGE